MQAIAFHNLLLLLPLAFYQSTNGKSNARSYMYISICGKLGEF